MHKLKRYRAWNISFIVTGRKEENMHRNCRHGRSCGYSSDYLFLRRQDTRAEKEEGKEALVISGGENIEMLIRE